MFHDNNLHTKISNNKFGWPMSQFVCNILNEHLLFFEKKFVQLKKKNLKMKKGYIEEEKKKN